MWWDHQAWVEGSDILELIWESTLYPRWVFFPLYIILGGLLPDITTGKVSNSSDLKHWKRKAEPGWVDSVQWWGQPRWLAPAYLLFFTIFPPHTSLPGNSKKIIPGIEVLEMGDSGGRKSLRKSRLERSWNCCESRISLSWSTLSLFLEAYKQALRLSHPC